MKRHFGFRSVRTALVFVLVLALVPSFIIIVLAGREHTAYLRENARLNTLRQVETVAEIQNRITLFTRQTLAMLAGLPMVRDMDPQESLIVLRAVLEANPDYINFTLTDTRGEVVASVMLSPGTNLADRKSIRDALVTGDFGAGEFVLSRAGAEPAFNFTKAVYGRDGRIAGAIGTVYRLSVYSSVVDNLNLPPGSFLGILDHAGVRLFYHPPRETNPVGAPIKGEMWDFMRTGGDTGTIFLSGSDGIRRVHAYKKLRLTPGGDPYMYFVLGLPEAAVMASARAATSRNLSFLGIVLAAALVITWAFSDTVFGSRLRAVIGAADRLHGGDFSARTGIAGDGSDLGQVAGALDRMAEALEHRESERETAARETERSMMEKEMLLREVHHRVKNNLQIILSLIRLQGDGDAAAEKISRPMEARVSAMALVHEMLYQSEDLGRVDLAGYVARLAELVVRSEGNTAELDLRLGGSPLHVLLERAIPFALAFNELLTNACKHALRGGGGKRITVELRLEKSTAVLSVSDDGPGLPEGFEPAASGGLGMRLVLGLVGQLGGTLAWENRQGAAFELRFPAV